MLTSSAHRWSAQHFACLSVVYATAVGAVPRISPDRATHSPVIAATLTTSRSITQSTTWRRGTVHHLSGVVRVADGATLTIEPGTRIEGSAGAAIVIERTGRIQAVGTLLEPIILGCPTGRLETRDCWGGLIVAGNAPVNGGTPDSPPVRGTGAAGCAQRTDDALAGAYGGCASTDNSGALRYVRIEFGVRGLQLLGVGSGTQVEFVQVHAAGSGGISLRGGSVDLRHALVTSSGPVGMKWTGGWTGRAQHLLVQSPAEGGIGIEGSNDASLPSAAPRSSPELYNVSVLRLSDPPGAPASTGIRIADGSGARFYNVLVAGFDIALDIDGAASCALAGTEVVLDHGIVASTGVLGDPDADSACVGGPLTEDVVLANTTLERITDAATIAGLLKAGFVPVLPDFRATSQLFSTRALIPPSNGFLLQSAFVGAVEVERIGGVNIPWHSGWTRDALTAPVVAFGSVTGVVSSAERGAFNGARVEAGGASALTSATGVYSIPGVVAGPTAVRLVSAPSGCTLPAPTSVVVLAGESAAADVNVACTPVTVVPNTLRLTYICGRTFRARNPNDAVVAATWDVFGTGDTGTLLLPARPLAGSASETLFETSATGTVRLLYNGSQADVKANGGATCLP